MQFLTKTFYFCAAHQYGHADWTTEKNLEVFKEDAKVHGHNYTLEITVKGEINPETGFIIELGHLRVVVEKNIIDVFDHAQIEKALPGLRINNHPRKIWSYLFGKLLNR